PGGAVIVTKNGKTVFRRAYGVANLERKIPLEPEMTFRIGSVTKQFTAAAIMLLADQGKLSVSDDITRFLPDYPTGGKKISIENLLKHTSGIRSYTDMPAFMWITQTDMTVQQMIDFFKDEPAVFGPGEQWAYSNSNYFLLGAIIEKASGMPYADFMAAFIFEPLGMKSTAYEGQEREGRRRVEGYSRPRGGQFSKARSISMTQPYASGALVSSVDDLARWNAAITAEKLLKPETWRQVFTPFRLKSGEVTRYGYGWSIGKFGDHAAYVHGGRINGFASIVYRLPEQDIYVAVLLNGEGSTVSASHIGETLLTEINKPD
ncbi:MAG: beta-lactamase family protein, partial [Candidatus Binatota bacterium]|nr:beta-lactamase family protein [Candidatus Binatota bacterium]